MLIFSGPRQDAHHGHAHRDTKSDLGKNHGLCTVSDSGINLDTTIHGAGMHDNRVGFGHREALGRERRRAVATVLAFAGVLTVAVGVADVGIVAELENGENEAA
jgi:hypothetical protein